MYKKIEPKRHEQMMELKNNGVSYANAIQIALKKQKSDGKNI